MKYLLGICLIFILQSCASSSYIVNEYINFPNGLNKEKFQKEVVERNKEFEKFADSLVPFSWKNKKLLVNETLYFSNTFIPLKEVKTVDSLVNLLSSMPVREWMWNNMDYKIYGNKGPKIFFRKKSTIIETNAKVEAIMNQLNNKLKFKYNSNHFYPYYLPSMNSYSKRLKK
jgi:hypothetical protein